MKRMISALMAVLLVLSGIPVVQAAENEWETKTLWILYGAARVREPVKVDADGDVYVPLDWIQRYGPHMVKEVTDNGFVYYDREQKDLKNYARRLFIDTENKRFTVGIYADLDLMTRFVLHDENFLDWTKRIALAKAPSAERESLVEEYFSHKDIQKKRYNDEYLVLEQGEFSSLTVFDNTVWAPIEEVLPLVDAAIGISDEHELCMQPVQQTTLKFLYDYHDCLEDDLYNPEDIVAKEVMIGGGWLVGTFTGKVSNLWGCFGKESDYKDLFTMYLYDSEPYLSSVEEGSNPTLDYLRELTGTTAGINSVLTDIDGEFSETYQVIVNEAVDSEFTRPVFKKDNKYTVSAFDFVAALCEYGYVYAHQIEDHRLMLDAVYGNSPPSWPSARAARKIGDMFEGDVDSILASFDEFAEDGISDYLEGKVLQAYGAWGFAVAITKEICKEEYDYVVNSTKINVTGEVVQYAFRSFEKNLYSSLSASSLNDARLSLMLSLLASRNAYKMFWDDTKSDEIERVDALLAALYPAGRWNFAHTDDTWKNLNKMLKSVAFSTKKPASSTKLWIKVVDDPFTADENAAIVAQFGESSDERFTACIGVDVKQTPASVEGLVSMIYLDLNNDKQDELVTLRLSERNEMILDIYNYTEGVPQLQSSDIVYNLSYCEGALIYLYYSKTFNVYCLFAEWGSEAAYTRINGRGAAVYMLFDGQIVCCERWEEIPMMTETVDFKKEFKEYDVPWSSFCLSYDNRDEDVYFQSLCEIEHTVYEDTSHDSFICHDLRLFRRY